MATSEQRTHLLAVACPWCKAAPGEVCTVAGRVQGDPRTERGRRGRQAGISTLDGGCHDARWQAAGLGAAAVVTERVAQLHNRGEGQLVPAFAGAAPTDRPW